MDDDAPDTTDVPAEYTAELPDRMDKEIIASRLEDEYGFTGRDAVGNQITGGRYGDEERVAHLSLYTPDRDWHVAVADDEFTLAYVGDGEVPLDHEEAAVVSRAVDRLADGEPDVAGFEYIVDEDGDQDIPAGDDPTLDRGDMDDSGLPGSIFPE